jgi:hypothetical protein
VYHAASGVHGWILVESSDKGAELNFGYEYEYQNKRASLATPATRSNNVSVG